MDYLNSQPQQPYVNPYLANNLQSQNNNLMQMMQTQNMQDNRFIYIQGIEAAKAYPIASGRTVLFLDDQSPYIYRKTTDNLGKTIEFRVFRLEEEVQHSEANVNPNYATKDDLNTLQSSIDELKGLILQGRKPYNKPRRDANG